MRVAVLSDIHANLVALDAVLATLGSVDAVWHLGDVVGYGPDPDGVVGRLTGIGAVGVRGNHDAAAAGGCPGALSPAAALTGEAGEGPIVCVISGGNVDLAKFCELIGG